MRNARALEIGGLIAGAVLVIFGAAALYLGFDGYRTVQDELDKEYIVGGSDMSPEEIRAAAEEAGLPDDIELPSCDVVDEEIDTGTEARCFAQYMRIHTLEATQGVPYALMGRFVAKPGTPKSQLTPDGATSNETYAVIDTKTKQPVENGARNIWVTETALTTALNSSYMAQQMANFGLVVGIALLLSGFGFVILALGGALEYGWAFRRAEKKAETQTTAPLGA